MSPEERLLLIIARRTATDEERNAVEQLLRESLNWDRIVDHCIRQDVYPLANENLKTLNFHDTPDSVRDHLTALTRLNAFRNQGRLEELREIVAVLSSRGITAVPLKGLALAHRLYEDINLRASLDIDVLVKPESAEQALQVLIELGYRPLIPEFQRELRKIHIECQLVKETAGGESLVELHWALLWSSKADRRALTDLWSEVQPASFLGMNSFQLTPEWEFLLLATHAARHQWEGLKWLADIHDLCGTQRIDWTEVVEKASRFGWLRLVRATLSACNSLFNTPIPSGIDCSTRPQWLKLFPESRSKLSRMLLPFRWLDGFRARLQYVWFLLFVQKLDDWIYVRHLPPHVRFLYTPFRFMRLLRKYSPQVVGEYRPNRPK